jgi:hypothetical protein
LKLGMHDKAAAEGYARTGSSAPLQAQLSRSRWQQARADWEIPLLPLSYVMLLPGLGLK